MTRRLHAACPACARVEALRPDGTMLRHMRYHYSTRYVCDGTGTRPAPDAVRAWLDAHEAEGLAAIERTEARVTRLRAELAAAESAVTAARDEAAARAAWCAGERGKR